MTTTTNTLDTLADNSLMLKVKEGNNEQMGLIYRRHSRLLFGFFYKLTGDGSTSEDLVHNVFMRMLTYKHTFTGEGKFTTWMYHLARNVHHDYLKKHIKKGYSDTLDNWSHKLGDSGSWEAESDKSDEIKLLERALGKLDSQKRELIVLHRFQGLKYKEIGSMYGMTESAVKVKVFRILKELKSIYEKLN